MKIRTRLFVALLVLVGAGFYVLIDWILDDLRPRYSATMEESMVDTATLLASWLENQVEAGVIRTDGLRSAFDTAQKRRFSAQIYELTKTRVNMRVYVTDRSGIVLFDSDNGRDEGKDDSRWNEVHRTMQGQYGARATRTDPDDPMTSTYFVASPIRAGNEIVGVLAVCKPSRSVAVFLNTAKRQIAVAGGIAAIVVVVVGMAVSLWIVWPVEKLTRYAKAIRDGKRAPPPRLGSGEIGALGVAFEEMRTALEGRQYVEEYIQTLTHQMKSPLSAIRGAAELLEEDMPDDRRRQFLHNLRSESDRIQDLIDRMLQLSALENRRELRDVETIDLAQLMADIIESMEPVLSGKRIQVSLARAEPVVIKGERFLVRQAVSNLLQNAVDFSEPGSEIAVATQKADGQAEIRVLDNGPGVPEYALDRLFDRFYSLRHPGTGRKSSGLGLAFVREVAELHGGRVTVGNRPEGGARAALVLPVDPPQPRF